MNKGNNEDFGESIDCFSAMISIKDLELDKSLYDDKDDEQIKIPQFESQVIDSPSEANYQQNFQNLYPSPSNSYYHPHSFPNYGYNSLHLNKPRLPQPYSPNPYYNFHPQNFAYPQFPYMMYNAPSTFSKSPKACSTPQPKTQVKKKKSTKKTKSTKSIKELGLLEISSKYLNYKTYLDEMSESAISDLLNSFSPKQIVQIYYAVTPHLEELMCHAYGNYFCSKFFKYLGDKERKELWSIIGKNIVYYGTHTYSNHSIQALVVLADDEDEESTVVDYIEPYIEDLIYNSHGSHIIQKIIIQYKKKIRRPIVDYILTNFTTLVCDFYGIRVVKKYIESISPSYTSSSSKRKKFISTLIDQDLLYMLSQDKYAHYSILYIFDKWNCEDFQPLINYYQENFCDLAIDKYSSRIILKCAELGNEDLSNKFTKYVISNLSNKNIEKILISTKGQNTLQQLISKLSKETLDILRTHMTHFQSNDDVVIAASKEIEELIICSLKRNL